MIPERILAHGDLRIAWHEATLTRLTLIGDAILPEGTTGWFRRTSRHRGTFLPNTTTFGVQIHTNDVEISPVHVETQYTIGEQP